MKQRWATVWLPLLLFAFLWADLVRQLGCHWSTNPQYAFGWSVPVLALLLLWEAWLTRPAPAEPVHLRAWILGASAPALAMLPARLFFEATPDWRLPLWVATAAVAGLSLVCIHGLGGTRWVRHFLFPLAFIAVGVPWPVKLEQPAIQWLSDGVAVLTVHAVNLCGTPAVLRGTTIEISTGVVGIEEACSGIRSFQAALMAALFLGQLFALRWRARLLLIALGAVVAFLCNVVRAGLLTLIADRQGLPAINQWHDSAGYTILFVCFAVLCFVARSLRSTPAPPAARSRPPLHPLPRLFVYGLACWVGLVVLGTEAWYRTATPHPAAWWRVELPEREPGYTEIPITEVARLMQSNEARAGKWRAADGRQYTVYFFRWLRGPATSAMLARFHRPELCLPSAGTKLIRESGAEILETGESGLIFRTYYFEQNGRPLHVFFCVWEDEKPAHAGDRPMESWTPQTRLEAVWLRRRKLGQQVLEVGVTGAGTEEEARAAFRRTIAPLLRPDPTVRR